MTATVTKLNATTKAKPVAKGLSQKAKAKVRRQAVASCAVGSIGLVLTALSLSHLSHGVEIVTGVSSWESKAMAVGIDLSFVALECAQLCCATEAIRKQVVKYSKPSIVGTMIGSAAMNAFAFGIAATGWWMVPAVALGLAIPALIYVLTRISMAMMLDCQK